MSTQTMTEGTVDGRHYAAGERGATERVTGREETDKTRLDVVKRVEDPSVPEDQKDREGTLLFNAIRDKFSKSPDEPRDAMDRFGVFSVTYTDAKKASEKIDDPAEVNKAILSLNAFNQQLGLGEYRVEIPEEADEKERQRLIKEKVKADVAAMPDKYAHHAMSDYYDHKAEVVRLQGEVASSLPQNLYGRGVELAGFPPREEIRLAAYPLQREADRVYWVEERLVGLVGDKDLKRELYDLRKQRLEYKREDLPDWDSRPQDEKDNLINQRVASLRQQILEGKGEKAALAFDKLSEDQRRAAVGVLVQKELALENAYKNLKTSLNTEEADRVTRLASEAKEARLSVKEELAKFQVDLATQRTRNAVSKLNEIRLRIARGPKQKPIERSDGTSFIDGVKERITAPVGQVVEQVKTAVGPKLDRVADEVENASDMIVKGLVTVEEGLDASIGRLADDRLRSLGRGDELQAEIKQARSMAERSAVNVRRFYHDKRHAIRVGVDRAKMAVNVEAEIIKRGVRVVERGLIGAGLLSEEEKAGFREKHRILNKTALNPGRAADILQSIKEGKTYSEKRKDVPEFQYFWNDIDKYVHEVSKPAEKPSAEATRQVEPRPTEPVTNEKFMADHPGLKEYEVVKYKFPGEEQELHAMFWWDAEKLHMELVRPDGSILMKLGSGDATTPREAKEKIGRIVQESLAEEGAEYKRFMRFSPGEGGRLSLRERSEEEFFAEGASERKGKLTVEFSAGSDRGKVRELDEDSFYAGGVTKGHEVQLAGDAAINAVGSGDRLKVDEASEKIFSRGVQGLYIVADGMGGHGAGEEASQTAITGAVEKLGETEDWASLSAEQIQQKIREVVDAANKSIFDKNQAEGKNSGTTFTMAMVINGNLYTANVGDSRVYLYDEDSGDLTRLTKDHSLVQELVDAGQITDDERYTHPQRNEIRRALGGNSVNVDVSGPYKVEGNVKVLAACDGLWELVRDPELKGMLAQEKPSAEIVKEMIDAANTAGGPDNITAVIADIKLEQAVEAREEADRKEPLPNAREGVYLRVSAEDKSGGTKYYDISVKNNTIFWQETDDKGDPLEGAEPKALNGRYYTEERARREIQKDLKRQTDNLGIKFTELPLVPLEETLSSEAEIPEEEVKTKKNETEVLSASEVREGATFYMHTYSIRRDESGKAEPHYYLYYVKNGELFREETADLKATPIEGKQPLSKGKVKDENEARERIRSEIKYEVENKKREIGYIKLKREVKAEEPAPLEEAAPVTKPEETIPAERGEKLTTEVAGEEEIKEEEKEEMGITKEELWNQLTQARVDKNAARTDYRKNKTGEQDRYTRQIENWGDKLVALNRFMTEKIPSDLDIQNSPVYKLYVSYEDRLVNAYSEFQKADTAEKMEKALNEYERFLRMKLRNYDKLSAKGIGK